MRTHPAPLPAVELPSTTAIMARLRALGFRFLYVIDAVTLFVLMHVITVARFGVDWPTFSYRHYFVGFTLVTVIHISVYYFGGMYEYEQRLGRRPWLPNATLLTAIAVLISAACALATGRYLMPRANLGALLVVGSLGVSINRWIARSVRFRRFGAPRILLVGNPDDVSLARLHLGESGRGEVVVGHTATTSNLLASVDESDATDVLLLSGSSLEEIYPRPLDTLETRLIGVYRRLLPVDTLLGLQRSREIAGMAFLALRTHTVPLYRLRLKRIIDLGFLVLLSPLITVMMVTVALFVRGRVGTDLLYRQERVGRRGVPFTLLKFRTMESEAEAESGATLATKNDSRIIAGVAWLRRSRLDELPQIWNVIRGEMSIVGPRPERPEFVTQLEELLPGYGRRHDTPPGITGLAQIRGHYQTDPGYKLGHDLQYIVNWSPVLDILIMGQTIGVMLGRSAR